MTEIKKHRLSSILNYSNEYYAMKVVREYETIRDNLDHVRRAAKSDGGYFQVLLEPDSKVFALPIHLIVDAEDEPPALDAYLHARKQILFALEAYLLTALSAKGLELLRDYNIDPAL